MMPIRSARRRTACFGLAFAAVLSSSACGGGAASKCCVDWSEEGLAELDHLLVLQESGRLFLEATEGHGARTQVEAFEEDLGRQEQLCEESPPWWQPWR